MKQPLEIVNQFLDLTSPRGRDIDALLPQISKMLAEDFVFSGPLMKIEGREKYLWSARPVSRRACGLQGETSVRGQG